MTYDTRFRSHNDVFAECCRWQHLVYVRTLKCGSEFFYRSFTQTAGWQPMRFQDIDWQKDLAFSYVMDPIKRRHKGICEHLIGTGIVDAYMRDDALAAALAKVPCMDEHSASLHALYGQRVHDIHWLLLDDDHSVGISQTQQLLAQHGHPDIAWNREFEHTTANYMDHIYHRVKSFWDDRTIAHHVRSYFRDDVDLYNRIKSAV